MRDNHKHLPEIISAFQRAGKYFGIIETSISEDFRQFEIGLQADAYSAIQKIIQSRPFDSMPGVKYRYFFTPVAQKSLDGKTCTIHIRIEQGQSSKQLDFVVPHILAQNLMWFFELKHFDEAKHLTEIT
jgi:hypothetical protein